jgi:nucleoside-diphosphate-sugar epimerase
MRAVVTGSAGFIGSTLAERLVADGWSVLGVDSFSGYYDPADKERNLAGLAAEPRFEQVRCDVAGDDLDALLRDRPTVFHLAAQPGVRSSFGTGFGQYLRDNVLATQRLFEAARRAGCPRVVFASSSSVYGEGSDAVFREDTTRTAPRSPYGVTKLACERLAEVYRNLGLEVVGLRYFTVYGPRQRPDMAIRRLCEAALAQTPFRLLGDGRQSRDFTYVDDAVDATVRAVHAAEPDPLLNIGGGEEATMTDLIEAVGILAGRSVPVVRSDAQPGDVQRTRADTSRARSSIGWRPLVGLTEGLRSELDWVADARDARVRDGVLGLARSS